MRVFAALLAVGVLLLGGVPAVSALEAADGAERSPGPAESRQSFREYWVAVHAPTDLRTHPSEPSSVVASVHQWAVLQVLGPQLGDRLYAWSPGSGLAGWIDARDVGPVDPLLAGTAHLPPIGARVLWSGQARVTMYTCVELGGCAATASGIWPEPGVVAVDPAVIPLGSKVWVQGLGVFLAADTGSLVKGAHLDVFSTSYPAAVEWGIRSLAVVVFE